MPASFAFESCEGEVVGFDPAAGCGTVRDRGGRTWFFHCTTISDGSRTIELGTEVTFDVVAGRLGRWEAARVRPLRQPS